MMRPSPWTSAPARPAAAFVAAVMLGACTGVPTPTPTASSTITAADAGPAAIEELSAEREVLATELASLRATLDALRSALDDAALGDRSALEQAGRLLAADLDAASDPDIARAAGDDETIPPDLSAAEPTDGEPLDDTSDDTPVDAAGTVGDQDGDRTDHGDGPADDGGDGAQLAPLLPGPVVSRATTVSYGDLLTTTLAAARSAGRVGEPIVRFLEAPLAGTLGTWQRAPDDQLAAIAEAGRSADLDTATAAVLDLTGEAPRALAWVVHGLTSDTPVEEVALRAAAHLAVIETALEEIS